jgi:Ca2+-binding RTX toxin-like protein
LSSAIPRNRWQQPSLTLRLDQATLDGALAGELMNGTYSFEDLSPTGKDGVSFVADGWEFGSLDGSAPFAIDSYNNYVIAPIDYGNSVFLNVLNLSGIRSYYMKSADGSDFQLRQFDIAGLARSLSTAFTISGYRDGAVVVTEQSEDLAVMSRVVGDNITWLPTAQDAGTLQFNAAFNDIDEIRIVFAGDQGITIDNIVVSPAVTPPAVSDAHISIASTGGGDGGAYKIGDTVTAVWDSSATGDNDSGLTGVTMDFSQFGGSATVTATNDGSGHWTASYVIEAGSVEAANRNVSVTATSDVGSTTVGDTTNLSVDNHAPDAPGAPVLASGSDSGASDSDQITNLAAPAVTGTAEANATVTLYDTDGTTVLGHATASNSGDWSIASSTLSEGDHTLTAKAVDAAGNVSVISDSLTVHIDTTAPTAVISMASASLHPGETTTITITFDEPVSDLTTDHLTADHGALSDLATADGGTTWTATLTASQVAGVNHIALDNTGVQDLAGNVGAGTTSSASYAIDALPTPPDTTGTDNSPPSVLVETTPTGNLVTGNDDGNLITSSGGADTVSGGGGGDTILGGGHNDILQGNTGADSISAGAGDDLVHGGQDNDILQGNTGNDILFGDKGHDTVFGGQGGDQLFGGDDDDVLSGDLGADTLQGNTGADTIIGGAGADLAFGGQGDDQLFGGGGDDFLSGDLGADTLTGGAGADTFHSWAGAGADLITDFNRAEGDRIVLDSGTRYTVSQAGDDVHIDMEGGGELILAHVHLSTLTGDWLVA